MFRAKRGISLVFLLGLVIAAVPLSNQSSQAARVAAPHVKAFDQLTTSAISALLAVNGGKPPATGDQLWKSLGKLGNFAQFPIVYSAVRLDSTLENPRVVIAHMASRVSDAAANKPNLVGRLYLAANMEKGPNGGDPRVTSVEFISWNTARRKFDFGVIENMGADSKPEFRLVDGGRCFACHKNRGPILGEARWSNSTLPPLIRNLVASKLKIVSDLPAEAPAGFRKRIDGMALVSPQARAVDVAVALGRHVPIYREIFRLMNHSPAGQQAFLALLEGLLEPGAPEDGNADIKRRVNTWVSDPSESFFHFQKDVRDLLKSTNSGVLFDFTPFDKKLPHGSVWGNSSQEPLPTAPLGGFRSANEAMQFEERTEYVSRHNSANKAIQEKKTNVILDYDKARAEGKHDMPSAALPSNPRAFSTRIPAFPRLPYDMINTRLLAETIGLSSGDCRFMTEALDEAAGGLLEKVSAKTLARAVFKGPEFADILAGGPLPDRDDFKDRFVAGLNQVLKTKYLAIEGIKPNRCQYAYGPRFDRNAAAEVEAAIVPTTSCLRCHDVRPAGKARIFESIPALAFDPLDQQARDLWMKSAPKERKQEVLTRIQKRLFKDADMPPTDSPEYELFRAGNAVAFDQLKTFLEAELAKLKKP